MAVGGSNGAVGGSCSVPEAARQLGISERAVRFRITSGALAATRTAAGWQVTLPDPAMSANAEIERAAPMYADGYIAEAGAEGGSPVAAEAVGGNGAVGHGGSEGGSAEAPAVGPTALDVALEELAFLRAELEARRREVHELHVLLAQRPTLPAPANLVRESDEVLPPDGTGARPWWARWRWWRR